MIGKRDPAPRNDCENEKYYSCVVCGPAYTRYELQFDTGTAAPTVGETITGETSGDTGVVVSITLESGSYAGADAAGTIELSGVTGDSDDLAFTDGETLTGSSTFVGIANTPAIGKHYGHRYPSCDIVERDGRSLCRAHYDWRYSPKDRDESKIEMEESTD